MDYLQYISGLYLYAGMWSALMKIVKDGNDSKPSIWLPYIFLWLPRKLKS